MLFRRLTEYVDKDSLLSVTMHLYSLISNIAVKSGMCLEQLNAAQVITRSSKEVDQKTVLDKLGWQTVANTRRTTKKKQKPN